jgi:hypothetical protein
MDNFQQLQQANMRFLRKDSETGYYYEVQDLDLCRKKISQRLREVAFEAREHSDDAADAKGRLGESKEGGKEEGLLSLEPLDIDAATDDLFEGGCWHPEDLLSIVKFHSINVPDAVKSSDDDSSASDDD